MQAPNHHTSIDTKIENGLAILESSKNTEDEIFSNFHLFDSTFKNCFQTLAAKRNMAEIKLNKPAQKAIALFYVFLKDYEQTYNIAVRQNLCTDYKIVKIMRNNNLEELDAFMKGYEAQLEPIKDMPLEFFASFRDRKITLANQLRSLLTQDHNFRLCSPCHSSMMLDKTLLVHLLYYTHEVETLIHRRMEEYLSSLHQVEFFMQVIHKENACRKKFIEEYMQKYKDLENIISDMGLFARFNAYKKISPDSISTFVAYHKAYCKDHGMGPQIDYGFDGESWMLGWSGEEHLDV